MTPMERRESLEEKILELFEIAEEPPPEGHQAIGLGKGDIKRILELEKGCKISINTVKSVVDLFLKNKVIKCINPNDQTGLRFRLSEEQDGEK